MICANGEYVESLSASYSKATHGIGVKCSGLGGEQYFGSRADNYADKIGWKNGKPPESDYKGIKAWYDKDFNGVGRLNIYEKNDEMHYVGRQTDQPEKDMNCDKGIITGVFGTTNGNLINTIGVRCSYKD